MNSGCASRNTERLHRLGDKANENRSVRTSQVEIANRRLQPLGHLGRQAFIPIYPNTLPTASKPSRASRRRSLVFNRSLMTGTKRLWFAGALLDGSQAKVSGCRDPESLGATLEAHFISYCRLLPPRQSAKLLEGNKMTGAGDGNRTEHPPNSE